MHNSQGFTSSSAQAKFSTLLQETRKTPQAGSDTASGGDIVSTYEVTFKDRSVEVIEDADAYQQEGPMTTFFATGEGRQVVDCWSTRLASFRTSEVIIIRRVTRVLPPVVDCEVVDMQTATGTDPGLVPGAAFAFRNAS